MACINYLDSPIGKNHWESSTSQSPRISHSAISFNPKGHTKEQLVLRFCGTAVESGIGQGLLMKKI
jgi:hypothetical protein